MNDSDLGQWYNWHGQCLWQHNNSHRRWVSTDEEVQLYRNQQNTETRSLLAQGGWLNPTNEITYAYNSQGFRCAEFDNRDAGLALGCSCTEGVGIREEYTWPCVLADLLDVHVWNLGIQGASNDTLFRVACQYIDQLNPKFVVVLSAPDGRLEVNTEPRTWIPVGLHIPQSVDGSFLKSWFTNGLNGRFNTLKNNLAIKKLCQDKNIPCWIFESQSIQYDRPARDCIHPGEQENRRFAQMVYQQVQSVIVV